MKRSAIGYYARSVLTLLTKFKRPLKLVKLFVGLDKTYPIDVETRRGLKFSVRSPMDVWVIKETCVDGDYDWGKVEIRPNFQIIDIGAGLGDFTIYAAKKAINGVVHAYEPLAASSNLFKQNVQLNQIENVTLFEEAVASVAGELAMDSAEVAAVSTRFVASTEENTVPATALATAIERLPNQQCDLLKIDCEGGEFDIILNSPFDVLQKVTRITLEFHNGYTDQSHKDLLVYLHRAGFSTRLESNPVHDYLGLIYAERRS